MQVTSGRATKVCVTKGHGEWALEEGGERSLSSLQAGLRHDNITWQAFETLGKKEVPKDCDALFVLGPTERRFLDERWADGKAKNISVRWPSGELRGAAGNPQDLAELRAMIVRYAE